MTGVAPPSAPDAGATSPIPNAFGIDPTLIPEALRDRRICVNWLRVMRDGKLTKIPCCPDGRPASVTDPQTWSSLAEVLNPTAPMIAGIGVVFDGEIGPDDLVIGGIDFDSLNKRREGEVDDSGMFARKRRATRIVREAQSRGAYVEMSPSGGGIHVLGRMHPLAKGCKRDSVEVYTSGRYFTVTTKGASGDLVDIADLTDTLINEIAPNHAQRLPGSTTPHPGAARTGPVKWEDLPTNVQADVSWWLNSRTDGGPQDRAARKRLWDGDLTDPGDQHHGDHSAADLSLVSQLIRRGLTDDEADLALRASGLFRAKWDRCTGSTTYGRLTISTARQSQNATASGGGTTGGTGGTPVPQPTPRPPGWPQPQALPIPLLPVPQFDPAWLPDLVRPFCLDVANSLPCPLDYAAVNFLITAGTVLGNKLLAEAKAQNSWLEAPNVWGLNVGDVSQMKTPSARPFMQQLDRLQARAQQQHDAAMAQWRGAMLAHQAHVGNIKAALTTASKQALKAGATVPPAASPIPPEPPEPRLKHYYTNDTTYEKLSELCRDNPYGVLAIGDEMSGFLSNLNREELRSARAFFLTGFNGTSSYKADRIMRGTTLLPRFAIGVLGNIQPDPLCQYLMTSAEEGQQNDGLAQRFGLLVWPDPVPLAFIDLPRTFGAAQQIFAAYDALAELDPQTAGAENAGGWEWFLRFEPAAHARFVLWLQTENFPARQDDNTATALRAHFGKYPKLVLGLALVLHLLDLVQVASGAPLEDPQGSIPRLTPIALGAVERAIEISRYAAQHARRVYHAGADPAYTAARLLAQRIAKGDLAGTTRARVIAQRGWSGLDKVVSQFVV